MAQQIYHHDYGLPEPLIVTLSRAEGYAAAHSIPAAHTTYPSVL